MSIPNEQKLKETYGQTLEQSLLVRRLELEAEARQCDKEFVEIAIGMIEYYQLRENWCMEQIKKSWGI
ncbi:MAG: hypothetical protein ACO4CS_15305 [bacterium]